MYASELIGKTVVRSRPAGTDESYMRTPIKIHGITSSGSIEFTCDKFNEGQMYYLKGLFCDDAWVEYSSSYVYVPRTASSSERLIVEPIPKPKVSIEHEVPVLKQEIPIHHIKSVSNTFECR